MSFIPEESRYLVSLVTSVLSAESSVALGILVTHVERLEDHCLIQFFDDDENLTDVFMDFVIQMAHGGMSKDFLIDVVSMNYGEINIEYPVICSGESAEQVAYEIRDALEDADWVIKRQDHSFGF